MESGAIWHRNFFLLLFLVSIQIQRYIRSENKDDKMTFTINYIKCVIVNSYSFRFNHITGIFLFFIPSNRTCWRGWQSLNEKKNLCSTKLLLWTINRKLWKKGKFQWVKRLIIDWSLYHNGHMTIHDKTKKKTNQKIDECNLRFESINFPKESFWSAHFENKYNSNSKGIHIQLTSAIPFT